MMLELARRLLAPSAAARCRRSAAWTSQAAARIGASGGHVIHMEVGQPATAAPACAIAAARAALGGRIDLAGARIPSLRARIAFAIMASTTGSRSIRSARSPPVPRAVSSWRSWRCSIRAIGSRRRVPGYPPIGDILTASSAAAGPDRDHSDLRQGDHAGTPDRGPSQEAAQGRAGGEPGQSDRHHDDRGGDREPAGGGTKRAHPLHLRRDLSWPRLCVCGW